MRRLLAQIAKFGIVGVLATLIDWAILMILSQFLGWDTVLSSCLSFAVSLVFNYFASMRYVFKRREDMDRRREFLVFVVLSLIGLAINALCMALGVALLGDSALMVTVEKIFATAVVMIWNFCSRKKWLDAK